MMITILSCNQNENTAGKEIKLYMKKLMDVIKQSKHCSRKTCIILGVSIVTVCGACAYMYHQYQSMHEVAKDSDEHSMLAFVEKLKQVSVSKEVMNLEKEQIVGNAETAEEIVTEVVKEHKAENPTKQPPSKEDVNADAPIAKEEKPVSPSPTPTPSPEPKPDPAPKPEQEPVVKPEFVPAPDVPPVPENKPEVAICPTSGVADEGSYYEEFVGVTTVFKDFYTYEEAMAFGLTLEPQSIRYMYSGKDTPIVDPDTGCKLWSIWWQKDKNK